MRILHFHDPCLLETGGVVRAVFDLCQGLAGAGHEVTLGTVRGGDIPESWTARRAGCPRGVILDGAFLPGRFFNRSGLSGAVELLRGAEVLHLHGVWEPFNTQLTRAARRMGVPYVYSVHGHLADWGLARRSLRKRVWLSLAGGRMLSGAAAVHTTTQSELDQGHRWVPEGRGVVIPLPLDLQPYRELPGPDRARARFPELRAGRPVLLLLSRLHPGKGIESLLMALAELRGRGRDCLAVIAGLGEEAYVRELHALRDRLGVEGSVLFAGFVAGEDKVSLFQTADLFVLPTSYESFGFVLFEALAAGTPVVTTKGAVTWPELQACGGGWIGSDEPPAIADAIETLLDDPARRQAMGRAGRGWVLEHLSAAAVLHRFEELYDSIRRSCKEARR